MHNLKGAKSIFKTLTWGGLDKRIKKMLPIILVLQDSEAENWRPLVARMCILLLGLVPSERLDTV